MKGLGKFLERMDNDYHHTEHRPMGWVFCDLLDYYYGMSATALMRERYGKSRIPAVVLQAVLMMVMKVTNNRAKWGPAIQVYD